MFPGVFLWKMGGAPLIFYGKSPSPWGRGWPISYLRAAAHGVSD